MPAGTVTASVKQGSISKEITAIISDGAGTVNYFGCSDGSLYTHTISDDSLTQLIPTTSLPERPEKVVAIVSGGASYIYIAFADGSIYRYAISGGAIVKMQGAGAMPAAIISMAYYGGYLYCALKGGMIYKVTTA